jgi:glutathione S-transferase
MKLYWGPHTCAIGIHILLEEVRADYKTEKVDVAGGGTQAPAFLAINPKGKVPTLVRDDGSVLTEFGAIATWLARSFADSELIPKGDPDKEARVTEAMEYVEGTIHGQGFARIFKPTRFEPQDLLHTKAGLGRSAVEKQGREIVEKGFDILNQQLAGKHYVAGDSFSIADAALFYVERWAPQQQITLPANVQTHWQHMLSRPSVKKVRELWGEA